MCIYIYMHILYSDISGKINSILHTSSYWQASSKTDSRQQPHMLFFPCTCCILEEWILRVLVGDVAKHHGSHLSKFERNQQRSAGWIPSKHINPSFGHRTSPTSPLFCRLNATASTVLTVVECGKRCGAALYTNNHSHWKLENRNWPCLNRGYQVDSQTKPITFIFGLLCVCARIFSSQSFSKIHWYDWYH